MKNIEIIIKKEGSYVDCGNGKEQVSFIQLREAIGMIKKLRKEIYKAKYRMSNEEILEFQFKHNSETSKLNAQDYLDSYLRYLYIEEFNRIRKEEEDELKESFTKKFDERIGIELGEKPEFNINTFSENNIARNNNENYRKTADKKIKDLRKNKKGKRYIESLTEIWAEDGKEAFLSGVSMIEGENEAKQGIELLSSYMNDIYHEDSYKENFEELRGDDFYEEHDVFEEEKESIYNFKKAKKEMLKERMDDLLTTWKAIEMIEENSGLLSCVVDGSGECINVNKLKKDKQGEIKSWLYVYSDGNGKLVDNWKKGAKKVGVISMSVFDGTNSNLRSTEFGDLRSFRVDRKFPDNFFE